MTRASGSALVRLAEVGQQGEHLCDLVWAGDPVRSRGFTAATLEPEIVRAEGGEGILIGHVVARV
ncbi:MAG TPA: hypothetical protein VIJ76_02565, partial [Galbitalea sp.]